MESGAWSWGIFVLTLCCYLLCSFAHRIDFDDLQHYEEKITSQNGEDGVLMEILQRIGVTDERFYVEFGVEDGRECNTRVLRERLNFTGLSMDGGHSNEAIGLQQEFITESNILDLLRKYSVSRSFDVLSVDVDMFDFWILARILGGEGGGGVQGYRPRVIIVETNPTLCHNAPKDRHQFTACNSIPLTVDHPAFFFPSEMGDIEGNSRSSVASSAAGHQYMWDLTRFSGANPLAFATLGALHGYEMVYCEHCGVNCFLVLREAMESAGMGQRGAGGDYGGDNLIGRVRDRKVHVPFIPYPCFGVSASNRAYAGHVVDSQLQRAAVRLTDGLLDKIMAGDVTRRDMTENKIACSEGGQHWGGAWCHLVPMGEFIFHNVGFDLSKLILRKVGVGGDEAAVAPTADELDWEFLSAVDDLAGFFSITDKDSSDAEVDAKLYSQLKSDAFTCTSHHKSEAGCVILSQFAYNAGVQRIRTWAAGQDPLSEWRTDEDATAFPRERLRHHLLLGYNELVSSERLCRGCNPHAAAFVELLYDYMSLFHEAVLLATKPPGTVLIKKESSIEIGVQDPTYGATGDSQQSTLILPFHMCDEVDRVADVFCANNIGSVEASGGTDSVHSQCVRDIAQRINNAAKSAFFPGYTFALLTLDAIQRTGVSVTGASSPMDMDGDSFLRSVLFASKNASYHRSLQHELPQCVATVLVHMSHRLRQQCAAYSSSTQGFA